MLKNRFYVLATALLLAVPTAIIRTVIINANNPTNEVTAVESKIDTAAIVENFRLPNDDEVVAGRYTNTYFGFTMTFPSSWAIAPEEVAKAIHDRGAAINSGDDAMLKASLEADAKNSYQLLYLSEQPLGTPTADFNSIFFVVAEKVSHLPGIVSGADYLGNMVIGMQQSGLPYQPVGEMYEVELGSRSFHRLDMLLTTGGRTLQQSVLVTVDKGYALLLGLTGDDASMDELEAIANSITF